jgi:hypothetical protein
MAPPTPRLGHPDLGIGVGLRTVHYREILDETPNVGWFEIITENFLRTQGRPLAILERVAERYPIVMHGVSLSIGSTDPLDHGYLREVAALRDRVGARWVSDHLCWTGVNGVNTHDLLPLPYTAESLDHVAARVDAVQQLWGAPLILENPSSYVEFQATTMPEWAFLAELCRRTGCGLLLDVNNVYVSSRNHGFDPLEYLRAVPMDRVVQVHVAGHTDLGTHCIDTHIGPVVPPVWALLRAAWQLGLRASILLEWDAEIPPLAEVIAEAAKARLYAEAGEASA